MKIKIVGKTGFLGRFAKRPYRIPKGLLKSHGLVGLLLIVLLLLPVPVRGQDAVTDLYGRINAKRAELGLHNYSLNSALSAAARNQAAWMVETGQVVHTRPDGNSVRDRTTAAGYASTWVSENIYMGSLATVDSAWQFWLNSPIHYQGLTNINYRDVGVGTASGNNRHAFVLVFGNPGGAVVRPTSSSPNTSGNSSADPGVPEQPPYVVGVDDVGNILHEIQPGDTLGQIALLYGYTWDDLDNIRALNDLTEETERYLVIGETLLIPPKDGTFTPTPLDQPGDGQTPEATSEVTADAPVEDLGVIAPTGTLPPESTDIVAPLATLAAESTGQETVVSAPPVETIPPTPEVVVFSEPSATTVLPTAPPTVVAAVPGVNPTPEGLIEPASIEVVVVEKDRTPTLLVVAVVLQIGLLTVAGVEFWRRRRG